VLARVDCRFGDIDGDELCVKTGCSSIDDFLKASIALGDAGAVLGDPVSITGDFICATSTVAGPSLMSLWYDCPERRRVLFRRITFKSSKEDVDADDAPLERRDLSFTRSFRGISTDGGSIIFASFSSSDMIIS
jgi:hypothetical protein